MKVWLTKPIPLQITIKGVDYEIRADRIAGIPTSRYLEAMRLDSGLAIPLQELPASWYRDEYDRHAWFESRPGTAAYRLANALLLQGLAVMEPRPGWTYRYEQSMKWEHIAEGAEYHNGYGWFTKTGPAPEGPTLSGYLIRY